MPELPDRTGESKGYVLLYWKAGSPPLEAPVLQSSLVRTSHDAIDVTPFGTKWRHYRAGRRRCLHKLTIKVDPEHLPAITETNTSIAVIHPQHDEHELQHCTVAGVRDLRDSSIVVVHALCESAREFL